MFFMHTLEENHEIGILLAGGMREILNATSSSDDSLNLHKTFMMKFGGKNISSSLSFPQPQCGNQIRNIF